MKIIELNNISKTYNPGKENELRALKDISLSIAEGEFVAIMGPSGSGKSTIMNIIGFLDTPTSGNHFFRGRDISTLNQKQLAQLRSEEIGFIFQNFNLLGRTTVLANAALPLLYSKKKNVAGPIDMLARVGLADKKSSKPNQLSGGQMQRVAIARALVNSPSLILADEPTGNLDSKTGEEIMKILRELNLAGNTIVMVTHDRHIADHASRIVQMSDGDVISDELTT